ncbi:hypothetical protein GJJ64_12520 [Pedobacter sp. HX-22-1]|jgi:hypothetical protein|uniref:Uncharacterized protein n=1 Tax=Pedobacter puniceum TaxID=2666136 RepID=A0A7K0FPX9_9SPHI|nr:hypothetical protein [Pedobacter puniceum]
MAAFHFKASPVLCFTPRPFFAKATNVLRGIALAPVYFSKPIQGIYSIVA